MPNGCTRFGFLAFGFGRTSHGKFIRIGEVVGGVMSCCWVTVVPAETVLSEVSITKVSLW